MRRLISFMTIAGIFFLLAACNDSSNSSTGSSGKSDQETVKIFQFKVEIAEALNKLVEEYEEETGVKVEVETVGGGADYDAALKAKLAGGEEPDIFNNTGLSQLEQYKDRAMDLSDQPWVDRVYDSAKQWMFTDEGVFGMPFGIEVHGLIYNKDLFEQAGITSEPETLSELRDAMKKLKDAGIQPLANGFGEWWILNQLLTVATASRDDPVDFSDKVSKGELKLSEDPIFQEFVKTLDTFIEYSNPNPLTTDYNTQVTMFASGEAAMMSQGNWTQVQIDGIDPDMNIGLIGIPIGDEYYGKVSGGVPNHWVVNKKGNNPEGAKKFLDWLVSSDRGKDYITNEFLFIPALEGIDYQEGVLGDIAEAGIEYIDSDNLNSWAQVYPDTYDKEFGAAMQAYVAEEISAEEMLQQFDKAIEKLRK
ncbi:extracellular solute-binding protein [Lederbergia ruris]|uniref:ABC transporter substrate-binding protein n=1 Tax=Lederbergia ruris TaxID=217495 RepID=UPI00399F8622